MIDPTHPVPSQKLPFNDYKHIPARTEIELLLGVSAIAELKRVEDRLELWEPLINWAFHWYDAVEGWGFKASFRERVLCVLHFYKGFFTLTLAVPLEKEAEFLAIKELTDNVRSQFERYTLSRNTKWVSFRLKTKADTEAVLLLIHEKIKDIKGKERKKGQK